MKNIVQMKSSEELGWARKEFRFQRELLERFRFYHGLSSDVFRGMIDDKIICVWGLIPPSLLSLQAYLWMYSSETIKEYPFTVIRQSRIEIAKMLDKYPIIIGFCDLDKPNSIKWLKWLGAVFADRPVEDQLHFTITRHG